jgi:hypothetical protein
MLISSSRDSHCRLEKFAPAGAERDIPNIAGGPLRAWARPVNAPERSAAARRSALLAERGLTGRDPRPYPLPASEWLGYIAAKSTADALPVLSSRSVSRTARGISAHLLRSPQLIWPCSSGRRCSPSRAADPLQPSRALPRSRPILVLIEHRQGEQRQHHLVHSVLVVFHCAPGLEFAARVTFRNSDNYRTDTEQSPDIHRMPQARRQRPGFRIFAQPSPDQRVYAMPACSGSAVSERKRQGTREKSKSLPHNKFTHVNAPAASGIPAAPHLGMTCHPSTRRRRRRKNPAPETDLRDHHNVTPHRAGIASLPGQESAANRHRKAPLIGPRSRPGSAAPYPRNQERNRQARTARPRLTPARPRTQPHG